MNAKEDMMGKRILLIVGHPDPDSYCAALAKRYAAGAKRSGANVHVLDLGRLAFDPVLKFGYRRRMELEDDLAAAQEAVRWAEHLVLVYPNWWGTMPALLKGFIDRVFLPGFAFRYRERGKLWDKLLKGRSARLIVTMDTPPLINRWMYGHAGHKVMKRNILQFCGIRPVRVTEIGPVRGSTEKRRGAWLDKAERLGERQA
jgi:putative NADPH-quinone reductase